MDIPKTKAAATQLLAEISIEARDCLHPDKALTLGALVKQMKLLQPHILKSNANIADKLIRAFDIILRTRRVIYVITYMSRYPNPADWKLEKPALVEFAGDDMTKGYWSGSPSHNYFRQYCILKEYPCEAPFWIKARDGKWDPDWDVIEIDYRREFHKPSPSELQESSGWLGPDGKFFVCNYYEHDSYARNISAWYLNNLDGTKAIEKVGWLRVATDGHICAYSAGREDVEPTQSQLDTMFDLVQLGAEDSRYRRNMLSWLRHYGRVSELGNHEEDD